MDFLCSILAGQIAHLQAAATLMPLPAADQYVGSIYRHRGSTSISVTY